MSTWKTVTANHPPNHRTVMAYKAGDLYPVVAYRVAPACWILEEGGSEGAEERRHPAAGGAPGLYEPTHYAEIDRDTLWSLEAP